MTPVLAIERALEVLLRQCFIETFSNILIKPPSVKFHSMYFKQRFASLPALLGKGYVTWYPEITVATKPEDSFDDVDLASSSMDLLPIIYGGGISRIFQLKKKQMKRQTNHLLRINHIKLGTDVIQAILDRLYQDIPPQPLIANFDPEAALWCHRAVSFDHMLTGKRFLCTCSMPYHTASVTQSDAEGVFLSGYFAECVYKEGLCHLCVSRVASEDERYGASVETNFEGYIDQVMFDLGVDKRTARAEIMHILGLSRWKRESALYGFVRDIFPDSLVLREASPEWLGRMRIDIYLPELKLAIEHQGEQHYRPLQVFGGEEAHLRVVARDELKRRLCMENGVEVVDFRFDAPLSISSVRNRLRRYWGAPK
ncbi:hypothetical protein [Pseudomonas atacamensis]|uniref:hypothetical protein n=1 Tax=Pseudomonas atacamensis TaxID=2565368 RepID=UPI001F21D518|nr:hypothetical protein [Pseudomonas atacamensis]